MNAHRPAPPRFLAALFVLLAVLAAPVQAQVCTGDVTLRSQAEVNAFNCAEVTGELSIDDDSDGVHDITNLTPMIELTRVGGEINIRGNAALASLAGLENITSVGYDLYIRTNGALSACACGLDGLISGEPPAFTGVDGSVYIYDNAPAGQCTSREVVLANPCPTVAVEGPPDLPTVFALSAPRPNPARGTTTLGFDLPEAGAARLSVYDVLGREVAVLVDDERPAGRHAARLDGSSLPAGTYFVRMEAGAQVLTQRLTLVR